MDGLDLRSDAVSIELSSIATKASAGTISGSNGNYTYSPNGTTGRVTLSLKTTNTSQLTSTVTRSITLSDGNKYYKDETNTIEQKTDKQTIAAGQLITNISKKDGFAEGGTINIYTNSNYTGTSVGYSYTLSTYTSGWNSYKNGSAKNDRDITLTGVKDSDTLYIRYVNGKNTYTGSFTLSDAKDNNGATITLTQQ